MLRQKKQFRLSGSFYFSSTIKKIIHWSTVKIYKGKKNEFLHIILIKIKTENNALPERSIKIAPMTQGTTLFIMRQVMEYTYYLLVGLTWRIAPVWSKHDPFDNLQCECPLISVTFVYYITITTTYVYLSFLFSLKSQGEFLVTIHIAYVNA